MLLFIFSIYMGVKCIYLYNYIFKPSTLLSNAVERKYDLITFVNIRINNKKRGFAPI